MSRPDADLADTVKLIQGSLIVSAAPIQFGKDSDRSSAEA